VDYSHIVKRGRGKKDAKKREAMQSNAMINAWRKRRTPALYKKRKREGTWEHMPGAHCKKKKRRGSSKDARQRLSKKDHRKPEGIIQEKRLDTNERKAQKLEKN